MKESFKILTELISIKGSLKLLLPELLLIAGFIIIVLAELFLKTKKTLILNTLTLVILCINLILLCQLSIESNIPGFSGWIQISGFSHFFRILLTVAGILTVLFTATSETSPWEKTRGEFYALLLLMLSGLNFIAMAANLLILYLSLELVSIISYIFSSFQLDKKSSEGGIKYFIFGTASSAIMLYGMSYLYGFTGTLNLDQQFYYNLPEAASPGIISAIVFLTLSGFLFKAAIFPFHIWVPDVYQSAPTPVSAFFSVAPKAVALAALAKILFPLAANVLSAEYLHTPLIIFCFITLAIGNFAALWQYNAKRLLAYSSIAHAAFAFSGLMAMSTLGIKSLIAYLSAYLIMNFAAFILVDILSAKAGDDDVRKFAGLGLKLPVTGVIFVVVMAALTGLPPTFGFYVKLLVFSSLWESYQATGNNLLFYLLIFGVLNAVVSLYYYLRIPYIMYFKTFQGDFTVKEKKGMELLMFVLGILMVILFFRPEIIMQYINSINFNFL